MTHAEYLALIQEIQEHDRHYFVEAAPVISDYEYDQKVKELLEYEKAHPEKIDPRSPSQRVAEAKSESFSQKEHLVPLYSLGNTYSEEEIVEFTKRVEKLVGKKEIAYFCELKIDGLALSLRYERGEFVQALTRGNGRVGDDVTANVKTIRSLPLKLKGDGVPDLMEVRGEVYMSVATFQELNERREEEGLEPFANPRNAAAGSLKLLDPKEVAKRKLNLLNYAIAEGESSVGTQHEVIQTLHQWGFPTLDKKHTARVHDVEGILHYAKTIEDERKNLPYEIDGIVVKVDELKLHKVLGHTGKEPRFAFAYKFAPEQAHTRILEITPQVGRTGVITPVAELEPVFLSGSTISRATLHNQEEVERKDIRVGDFVYIEKGGDVIPKVVRVDLSRRPEKSQSWKMPVHCPACGTPVVHQEGEVAVRCPNRNCLAQRTRQLINFASKQAMDIEHMGQKVVEQLVAKKLISRPSDIYLLNEEKLMELEGFKEKSVQNLLASIEVSRNCTLPRLIMGLGIPHVGVETAELLAEHFGSIEKLIHASAEELLSMDGIGEKTAQIVVDFFQDSTHREEIQLLLAHGVKPTQAAIKKIAGHLFSGKTFVLTGALENYSREAATALIKERGGSVSSSVSKQTDYLLVGAEPGSKHDKAKKLGIKILDEKEFQKLLE
ncbi:MAG TPA: NAD-dependent DNA ligase LigA [Chlamydiales bacterium]